MQEQVKQMPTAEPHPQLCEFQASQGCTPQKQIPNLTECVTSCLNNSERLWYKERSCNFGHGKKGKKQGTVGVCGEESSVNQQDFREFISVLKQHICFQN